MSGGIHAIPFFVQFFLFLHPCPPLRLAGVKSCQKNYFFNKNVLKRSVQLIRCESYCYTTNLRTALVWYTSHFPLYVKTAPPLRRETVATGPSFLRADLITAFKVFTGLLDIDPNLFFLPHTRRSLRGHLYKVLKGESHPWRGGSAFSVRVVKYWNRLL